MPDFNSSNRSAEPISVALNALIEASIVAEQTRGYLGASAIGHECLRRIQFDWMCDPEHPARLRDIFDRGHYFKSEAGGIGGGMPGKPMCSYMRVEPYRHKPGKRQWVYHSLEVGQILVSAKACRAPGTGQKSEPLQQA